MESGYLDAVYVSALSQLPGMSQAQVRRILRTYRTAEDLRAATQEDLERTLGRQVASRLRLAFTTDWSRVWQTAEQCIARHVESGVVPIPLTSAMYPPLLALISDPPVLLFAKGDVTCLQRTDAVAVVGTRQPTDLGRIVARRIAHHFATQGYVIVSGLAKGIDTAAHAGALDAGGATVAVLATALDRIYPAENKGLAERICAHSGALVTEYAFGRGLHKRSFVQRDRIQSGLSLAILPVQTTLTGGTMHTVTYAGKQHRRIVCPRPLEAEASLEQYAGIRALIDSGTAQAFQANDYPAILEQLQDSKHRLLSAQRSG